jgi:hypothetical protein
MSATKDDMIEMMEFNREASTLGLALSFGVLVLGAVLSHHGA